MNDKSITVRLPKALVDRLDGIKKKTGCPVSETVRRALEAYLLKGGK